MEITISKEVLEDIRLKAQDECYEILGHLNSKLIETLVIKQCTYLTMVNQYELKIKDIEKDRNEWKELAIKHVK